MSIQPLPPEVIAQIKSSATITSLNSVVFDLVQNSLDAGATTIDITVDYGRGGCVVEDDGQGILPSEFGEKGGLGKLYHSSKLQSEGPMHGGRGTFLASLAALSLLQIVSHHHLHHSQNLMSLHKSRVVARQTPAPTQFHLYSDHGTRVTVRDLFGSMPVRVKQRATSMESASGKSKAWECLKRDVVAELLAWPSNVSLTIQETGTSQRMSVRYPLGSKKPAPLKTEAVETSNICRILTQASYISAAENSSWTRISASTPKLAINGVVSLEPSATKHVQFLALGIQPLLPYEGQNILYEEINRLFLNSAFGDEEEVTELDDAELSRRTQDRRYKGDSFTNKQLKGGKKGIERWPMFYINIQIVEPAPTSAKITADDVLDGKGNSLSTIIHLLHAVLTEFLARNHFRPRTSRHHRFKDKAADSIGHSSTSDVIPQLHRGQSTPTIASSYSASNASSTKPSVFRSLSQEGRMEEFDVLGTNLKTPGLKPHSSYLNSPFNAWSRVKSGATSKYTKLAAAEHPLATRTPCSPRDPPTGISDHGKIDKYISGCSNDIMQPLVSKTGKITRQPFADVDMEQPSWSTFQQEAMGDGIVAWVNPVTKVRSLVDIRTGNTVPKSKENVNRQSAIDIRGRLSKRDPKPGNKEPSPWISDILTGWNNPVFRPAEIAIPQAYLDAPGSETQAILHGRHHNCSQVDIQRAFTESSTGLNGRISKDSLRGAEVISQVDKKFMLVKLNSGNTSNGGNSVLAIIDQHAADERIRIEALMEELCAPSTDNSQSGIKTIPLEKPLAFEISPKEVRLLSNHISHFSNWGIIYDLPSDSVSNDPRKHQRILVRRLPPGIIERCKLDQKLLLEFMRTEAWKLNDEGLISRCKHTATTATSKYAWLQRIHDCPQGIMDILNSRACRSAIMFNDELSTEQCKALTRRLAECAFPFQCAHGRPSMVPVVDLSGIGGHSSSNYDGDPMAGIESGSENFRLAFKRWKRNLK